MRNALLCFAACGVVAATGVARAQTCPAQIIASPAKGKISRNMYRAPYADGTWYTHSTSDYFGHGGSFDTFSIPSGGVLVAPADGVICLAVDHLNDCGCTADSSHAIGGCGNQIALAHANGEMSAFLHVQQFSIRNAFGVSNPADLIGMPVAAGQMIALEGDVGRTCGNTSGPRWGTCISQAQAAGLGNCGSHAHWNIRRMSTGELLQPMTCDVLRYLPLVNYQAHVCSGSILCQPAATYNGNLYNNYGETAIFQHSGAVTVDAFVVENLASVVMRSESRVRLRPGFRAGGDGYFRAEIGNCNQTAPTP